LNERFKITFDFSRKTESKGENFGVDVASQTVVVFDGPNLILQTYNNKNTKECNTDLKKKKFDLLRKNNFVNSKQSCIFVNKIISKNISLC